MLGDVFERFVQKASPKNWRNFGRQAVSHLSRITYERRFPRSEMLQQSGMRLRSFCPENRMTCDGRVDRFILPRGELSKGF